MIDLLQLSLLPTSVGGDFEWYSVNSGCPDSVYHVRFVVKLYVSWFFSKWIQFVQTSYNDRFVIFPSFSFRDRSRLFATVTTISLLLFVELSFMKHVLQKHGSYLNQTCSFPVQFIFPSLSMGEIFEGGARILSILILENLYLMNVRLYQGTVTQIYCPYNNKKENLIRFLSSTQIR